MKISFVINHDLQHEAEPHINKAVDFLREKTPLNITYDIKVSNLEVLHTVFQKSEHYNKYLMGTFKMKEKLRPVIPENDSHIVVFVYDITKNVFHGRPGFAVASWSFFKPLYPRTEYTEIAFVKNHSGMWHTMTHELIHAFVKRANRNGRNVRDEMDLTIVNGKEKPYYKNNDPYAKDGNYAHTLANLAGNWDMVQYFPELDKSNDGIYFDTGTYRSLKNLKKNNVPKWILVHHTGGTDDDPLADTSHHTAKTIENWHLQKGWDGLGYHFVIEKTGKIYAGRPEHRNGAHAKGYNTKSIGICLSGNFDATVPTEEQKQSLRFLLANMSEKYNIKRDNIVPHRTFANKTCYGKKLGDTWARDLLPETVVIENSDAVIEMSCSCKKLSEYSLKEIRDEFIRRFIKK